MPLDANFNPMVGAGAGTLFPQAGPPSVMTVNIMQSDQHLVTTIEEFNAAVRALVYNGDASVATTKRFGIYRALQLAQVYELRDSTPMSAPPPGAVYYPWRIYVGHSYGEIVEGDSSTFTADVGAKFVKWGAEAGAKKSEFNLQTHVAAKGLSPKSGAAIFAHDPQEIANAYAADPGQPVPIVVEYRQIPNTRVVDGTIVWVQPKNVTVRFTNLQVSADGAAIKSYATWKLGFQCFINGQAAGPQQQMQQDFAPGAYPLAFTQTMSVNDNDTIECTAGGQYLRMGSWDNLGPASTGPIAVGRITSPSGNLMQGKDAKTNYSISWTATK